MMCCLRVGICLCRVFSSACGCYLSVCDVFVVCVFFFFFQAEDGIRDTSVTGVQTCALPIWLAEMATRTEAARLLVYAAADAYDRGAGGVTRRSAMAKLFATEVAQFVVDGAVQIGRASCRERV